MSDLVADCPRCNTKSITFHLVASHLLQIAFGWQRWYEAFSVCKHCGKSTVFVLSQKAIENSPFLAVTPLENLTASANGVVNVEEFVSISDRAAMPSPEHLPPDIEAAFREGATCLTVRCFNAACTMFRLCIDLATRKRLPEVDGEGLTPHIRRTLGLRLKWMFDHGCLDEGLRDLSLGIKEDGNDGAHQGTLEEKDAEDIQDFTFELLEQLYTKPKRLVLAKERRENRRAPRS
jgi:hypothetical protein